MYIPYTTNANSLGSGLAMHPLPHQRAPCRASTVNKIDLDCPHDSALWRGRVPEAAERAEVLGGSYAT